MPRRTYEKPLKLDMDFGEALGRFDQTEPQEVETEMATGELERRRHQTKGDAVATFIGAFEDAAHQDDMDEYWLARELRPLLGYSTREKFQGPIDKAKAACAEAGEDVEDHFHHVVKNDAIGQR